MWSISPQRDTSSFCRPMAGQAAGQAAALSGGRDGEEGGGAVGREGGGQSCSGGEHRLAPFIGAREARAPPAPLPRPLGPA